MQGRSAATSATPCVISSWQLLLAACALRSSRGTSSSTSNQVMNKCSWVLHQNQATPSLQWLQAQHMQKQPPALREAVMSTVSAAHRIGSLVSDGACLENTVSNIFQLDEQRQVLDRSCLRQEQGCSCPAPLHSCSALRGPHTFPIPHVSCPDYESHNDSLIARTSSAALNRADGAVRMSFGHSCSIALFAHTRRKPANGAAVVPSVDVVTLLHLLQELHNLSFASSSKQAAWTRARLQYMSCGTESTRCAADVLSLASIFGPLVNNPTLTLSPFHELFSHFKSN